MEEEEEQQQQQDTLKLNLICKAKSKNEKRRRARICSAPRSLCCVPYIHRLYSLAILCVRQGITITIISIGVLKLAVSHNVGETEASAHQTSPSGGDSG